MAFKMSGILGMMGAGRRGMKGAQTGIAGPEDIRQPGPFFKDDKFVANNPNAKDPMRGKAYNPSVGKRKKDTVTKVDKVKPTSVKPTGGSSADKIVRSKPDAKKSNSRYDTKTKTGRNLLGQKRNVTKYYDKETGRKVGKKVEVTKKDGKKKAYKDRHGNWSTEKTKRVNTGLSREGGVAKIREKAGFFDAPAGETTAATTGKPGRLETTQKSDVMKEFVRKDAQTGEDKLDTYAGAFGDKKRWTDFEKDGVKMKRDKFGNEYTDDEAGYDKFKQSAKSFWSDLADKTQNEELRRDTQTGKMDSPMNKKKRGYKMKGSPFLNYKKGYYGEGKSKK